MNRRWFLQSLLATAVLDPERLLWVPGQKTIFIPPPPMSEGISVQMIRSFDMEERRWITRWSSEVLWMPLAPLIAGPSS